ncbi:TPA: NAD glycohydrolase toxin immunity factor [Streptococcus suis]
MPYKKPNQKMMGRYLSIYQRAQAEGKTRECYLGQDKDYRIISRDSYICSVTDPEVLLEFVLYPLYVDGTVNVKSELLSYISDFILSENPIEYYQAYSFLCGEMMLTKVYGDIPFRIFDRSIAKVMYDRLHKMENKLQNFKEGDFGKYKNTMYDMICEIVKSSELFA